MKVILIISFIALSTAIVTAGTLPLLKAGKGAPGGGGACSNSLDFTQACNSQYITVI